MLIGFDSSRVAHMLVDVGPSVTITSLTNFLAFLVGIYTPTPEIQLFCMGNSVAIMFDFFYQVNYLYYEALDLFQAFFILAIFFLPTNTVSYTVNFFA